MSRFVAQVGIVLSCALLVSCGGGGGGGGSGGSASGANAAPSVLWTAAETTVLNDLPAIAPDGTVYLASGAGLYALNPLTGAQLFSVAMPHTVPDPTGNPLVSPPAVASDGSIWLNTNAGWLLNYSSTGVLLSEQQIVQPAADLVYNLAIAPDGALWTVSSANTHPAVLPPGAPAWTNFNVGYFVEAIGSDNTAYLADGVSTIFAAQENGTIAWTLDFAQVTNIAHTYVNGVQIGPDGKLYLEGTVNGVVFLAAVRNGAVVWMTNLIADTEFTSQPVIAPNGSIYIGYLTSTNVMGIVAYNSAGELEWNHLTPNQFAQALAVGDDNSVYAPVSGGVLALNFDGTQRWSLTTPDINASAIGITINSSGTILVTSDMSLVAFGGHVPLATSGWPKNLATLGNTSAVP
jgi:hypothetical protein